MKKLRILGLAVLAAHLIVAVWHLFLVAKILPAPENNVSWFAICLITLGHLGVSVAWLKLSDRFAGLVLCIFLVAALGAGIYEHFLGPGLNNIFRVAPGDWTALFRASVIALVILEALGCWVGVRVLMRGGQITSRTAKWNC